MIGFLSAAERISNMKEQPKYEPLSYGNPYLDDCLGGIFPFDLVVMTAKTGSGKTELATHIAYQNALAGKKVHFFALEADQGEIERRIKFKKMSQAYYYLRNFEKKNVPNYQDWILRGQDFLDHFGPEIDQELNKELATLKTFYRDKDFTMENFESLLHQIGEDTDLIILDHLHYFDFDEMNENQAMKKTVKQIRMIQQHYHKPIVLVCHIRKGSGKMKNLIPDEEDIHGSSDIAKIATRIIVTSPARDLEATKPTLLPTYFRVCKNRYDGARTWFVGVVAFDLTKNEYEPNYKVGRLNYENTEVEIIEPMAYPNWARPTSSGIL